MPIHNSPRQPMLSYSSPQAALDSRKPIDQDPCNISLMRPRERAGQDSIASAAPAGHSAPMPMPSSAPIEETKFQSANAAG
jgi:hypothetical protein